MLHLNIKTESKYDLPTRITNGTACQQTILELKHFKVQVAKLLFFFFFSPNSYCLFLLRRLRIRTSCTFLCAIQKKQMFRRTSLVLYCPFLSWHPLVGALVCSRYCATGPRCMKTYLEALCVHRRRPAAYPASRNW